MGERAKTLSPTKKNLLSVLASLFDPLGVVSPVIVCAKILFQEVCKDKVDWDENFTEELLHKWEGWYRYLIETKEITIPRCIYQHRAEDVLECTLHGFGDASKKAYCAVVLTSKARVAPLKAISFPRLELMSARLLAQIIKSVKASLENQVRIDSTKFWLDSMTALYWIMNKGEWKQFVHHHRVNEILKHYPGDENPADIGSSGVIASQLKDNKLWWMGPAN